MSHDAFDFMDEHAVIRALSCRYRQSQDGVAESVWRVAFAAVRASLNGSISDRVLRRRMWALALHQRINIIGNGMPTSATGMQSPYVVVAKEKMNLKSLRTMWCAAAAHIPIATRGEHHTDRVARMGVHCGQSSLYKGYMRISYTFRTTTPLITASMWSSMRRFFLCCIRDLLLRPCRLHRQCCRLRCI